MYNHIDTTDFQITIHQLEGITFKSTKFTIPGISGADLRSPTPFNQIALAYDQIEYSPLSLDFIVDEDLSNYKAAFNWMRGIGFDKSFEQRANLEKDLVTDVTVILYNSSQNPTLKVEFKNCRPTSLSDIQLSTNETDVVYPHATLTMNYDYYDFE